jgi:hypothetical protein
MEFIEFKKTFCPVTPRVQGNALVEGWGSTSSVIKNTIQYFEPKSIVEVGTWLGASALFMSQYSTADIICVDTYLGSNEILWRDGNVKVGQEFDSIYKQFCINVTKNFLNDQISPLPMTSSSAAQLFSHFGVTIDMVYIDAGHSEREVYADLEDWWPLTNKVLIGDDYSENWPGVVRAVKRFCAENKLTFEVADSKYSISKLQKVNFNFLSLIKRFNKRSNSVQQI